MDDSLAHQGSTNRTNIYQEITNTPSGLDHDTSQHIDSANITENPAFKQSTDACSVRERKNVVHKDHVKKPDSKGTSSFDMVARKKQGVVENQEVKSKSKVSDKKETQISGKSKGVPDIVKVKLKKEMNAAQEKSLPEDRQLGKSVKVNKLADAVSANFKDNKSRDESLDTSFTSSSTSSPKETSKASKKNKKRNKSLSQVTEEAGKKENSSVDLTSNSGKGFGDEIDTELDDMMGFGDQNVEEKGPKGSVESGKQESAEREVPDSWENGVDGHLEDNTGNEVAKVTDTNVEEDNKDSAPELVTKLEEDVKEMEQSETNECQETGHVEKAETEQRGMFLKSSSLPPGRITPVVVSEIVSPWCFFVNQNSSQLPELMKDIG